MQNSAHPSTTDLNNLDRETAQKRLVAFTGKLYLINTSNANMLTALFSIKISDFCNALGVRPELEHASDFWLKC